MLAVVARPNMLADLVITHAPLPEGAVGVWPSRPLTEVGQYVRPPWNPDGVHRDVIVAVSRRAHWHVRFTPYECSDRALVVRRLDEAGPAFDLTPEQFEELYRIVEAFGRERYPDGVLSGTTGT